MNLYFAGGEAWADLLLPLGVKHILFSYFYFRSAIRGGRDGGKAATLLARLKRARQKGYRFFLDSGAFTYQEKLRSGKGASLPPPQAYYEEFAKFCEDYSDCFDIIAELDIEGAPLPNGDELSINQVNEWTDDLIDRVGMKVMPVYHPARGKKWLQDWLLDTATPYVGFGSDSTTGANAVIAAAHRHGKWVHGFAQTRINTDLKFTNFDSVDSTTWLRADKYGGSCIFKNGKWIVLDHHHKHQRALHRDWYESWGLDFSLIAKDDLYENRKATVIAWRELASSFEAKKMFQTRGKLPYLLDAFVKGKPFTEHPILMAARMRAEAESAK